MRKPIRKERVNNYKILYITTVASTVDAFLIPHIRALQARGYGVEVACNLKKNRYAAENIRKMGISSQHIPFERSMIGLNTIRAFLALVRIMRTRKYDLVHVHTPVAAFLGRLAARIADRRIKTLYTAHGLHFVQGGHRLKNIFFLALEKLASSWTDALIVMNKEDYEAAQRYGLAGRESLFFVNGVGVDVNKFRPELLSSEEKEDFKQMSGCGSDKVVGMIAEFIPRKRHIDLINAAEKILQEYNDVAFILIGDGQLLPKLKHLASAKNYRNKIKFLGHRQDVPELLASMDILVLPSLREGLPRSLQEAMATGIPVVATDVKGDRDLVRHEETGLLVPPRDPEALAQAILKLLQDEDLAERMGKRAREIAVSELSLDKIVEQTVVIQEELLDTVAQMSSGS
jgi:glycosyltransferase involved in cell wall biosynthesis